jgi:hypothetical protein
MGDFISADFLGNDLKHQKDTELPRMTVLKTFIFMSAVDWV